MAAYERRVIRPERKITAEYRQLLTILIRLIDENHPPFLILPGRSAIQLGEDLIRQIKKNNGLSCDAPAFIPFPISSDNFTKGDYFDFMTRQIAKTMRDFGIERLFFLDDYALRFNKIKAINECVSRLGYQAMFYLLASRLPPEKTMTNVKIVSPGNEPLCQYLSKRAGFPINPPYVYFEPR